MKPRKKRRGPLGAFFGWFNRVFKRSSNTYINISTVLVHKAGFSLIFLAVVAVAAVMAGRHLPSAFLPDKDQGYLLASLQLPDASSLQRTDAAAAQIEKIGTEHARRGRLHHGSRLQPAERRRQQLQRILFRPPEELG